jgi:transcriptional regulator NrdR family protein
MLDEATIKVALIDKLIASGLLHNAVLINELVVANWSRRADIAVANGKLHAFEIKSDVDNLRRLDGQVTTYLDQFDKVTVVTTSRYADPVLEMMPEQVEVWEARPSRDGVDFKVVRRGKTQLIKCKSALLRFLTKEEMLAIVRKKKISGTFDTKKSLTHLIEANLSVKDIRECVLDSLKKRYKETYAEFISSRNSRTQQEDLHNLSKSKLMMKRKSDSIVEEYLDDSVPLNARYLDLEALQQKFGMLPEGMPRIVLTRRTVFT